MARATSWVRSEQLGWKLCPGVERGEGTSVSVGGGTIQIHVGAGSDAATADVPRSFNFEAGAQKDRT
jgi:hypothetical protein